MDSPELKRRIKLISASEDSVSFSKHFDEKARLRSIYKDDLLKMLSSLSTLISIEDQGDEQKGHKYALVFSQMSNYNIKVVISLKTNALNIVTAHIMNKKRMKRYLTWLGSQK